MLALRRGGKVARKKQQEDLPLRRWSFARSLSQAACSPSGCLKPLASSRGLSRHRPAFQRGRPSPGALRLDHSRSATLVRFSKEGSSSSRPDLPSTSLWLFRCPRGLQQSRSWLQRRSGTRDVCPASSAAQVSVEPSTKWHDTSAYLNPRRLRNLQHPLTRR
jgi:hypothetical protein